MITDREKVISNLQGVYEYLRHFENTAKMGEWVADALALLKEQEAVVRCKDCNHWDYRTEGCVHLTGRIAPIVKTGADWYCCDGERKDT